MTLGIYPGSFDPVTVGHMDIIERAAPIFDKLIVAVMVNARKKHMFSLETRLDFIKRSAAHLPNVEIDCSDLLLAEYARQKGAHMLVRGLRAVTDFEHEFQMALMNRKLNPALDTLFLTSGEHFQYLSSSVVKEIGSLGGDISDFVPASIYEDVRMALHTQALLL